MEQKIKNFSEQFQFEPIIENKSKLKSADSFVVGGMGGSHLSAGLIKMFDPSLDIYIHRDYGLPQNSEKRFKKSIFIASSYSGNTEETLDFAEKALAAKHRLAIVSTGGRLIDFAKEHKVPYILMPQSGLQPRDALGYSFMSLLKLMNGDKVEEIRSRTFSLNYAELEKNNIAEVLKNKVPIVYSSRSQQALAYSWKIKFNETAKIPAFHNVFPELNHNEMTGFDVVDSTKNLSTQFHFIFLKDESDEPRIAKRMEVLQKMYEDRGFGVTTLSLHGNSPFEKIFNSIALADVVAHSLADIYGVDPEQVPMIEEFKKLIS